MKQVIEIFTQLQNTASKNDKISIIKENSHNQLFCKCLRFLLDSNIITGISKNKMNKAIVTTDEFRKPKFTTWEDCMEYLEENNTGRDCDLIEVQTFLNSVDAEDRIFYEQMITKSLKLGCDSKTVNAAIPNLIPTFNVMLGTPIEKCKLKPHEWISISRKLNGTRCIFYNGEFYSRQGKKYTGLDHIKSDLEKVVTNKNLVIDGELIYKNPEGLSDSEAFQIGVGIANSKAEQKPELKLVIFDLLRTSEFENGKSTDTYEIRRIALEAIQSEINIQKVTSVEVVPLLYCGDDHSQIQKWLDYAEDNDWEGVMVNTNALYECKRTKTLIKVKKFYTMDLQVVDYEEGDGRLQGTLGALVVNFRGNAVRVGSGYDDATRASIWDCRDDILGRVIEVKYKEVSKNKENDLESLQFPVFVCVREQGKKVSYN